MFDTKSYEPFEKIEGRILFSEPMRNHTTFHIGGPADCVIIPKKFDDIKYVFNHASEREIPLQVIGNGSKILISDRGIRGIVIKIAETFNDLQVSSKRIIVGAGCSLQKMIKIATLNNLGGIEFAAGIPGTVGGAIAMNAGTYLGSMSDIVEKVTVMDLSNGSLSVLTNNECSFRYRESIFHRKRLMILEAQMKMKKTNRKEIEEKVNRFLDKRKRTQPLDKSSAGSIFKNPTQISAGKLIDMAGLKGFRKGDARISEMHANFIINLGNALASDVMFLMKLAQEKVKQCFDITLEPEIILMGDFE